MLNLAILQESALSFGKCLTVTSKKFASKFLLTRSILDISPYSFGCLWHSHGKNPVRLYPNCKAGQQDCVKSLSIISSSKLTNGIVQNLYRFLIDLLPLKNVSERFIVRTNCKASQQDCLKSLSIISSSKPTNQIVQNLYRFLIDLLPLKNVSERSLPKFFHSCFRMVC